MRIYIIISDSSETMDPEVPYVHSHVRTEKCRNCFLRILIGRRHLPPEARLLKSERSSRKNLSLIFKSLIHAIKDQIYTTMNLVVVHKIIDKKCSPYALYSLDII